MTYIHTYAHTYIYTYIHTHTYIYEITHLLSNAVYKSTITKALSTRNLEYISDNVTYTESVLKYQVLQKMI
jgi:hypothetical protein